MTVIKSIVVASNFQTIFITLYYSQLNAYKTYKNLRHYLIFTFNCSDHHTGMTEREYSLAPPDERAFVSLGFGDLCVVERG